jgi:3-oxoacyl-[acyl-carrier protein] reductase
MTGLTASSNLQDHHTYMTVASTLAVPSDAFAADHFSGQTVFITGAAGGMGLETARSFAAHGAHALLTDLDGSVVERHAEAIRDAGGQACATALDVGDPASIDAAFAFADAQLGRIDNLVTCAAVITSKRLGEMDWQHWRRVLDINLLGTAFVVQAAVTRMLQAGGGKIVCVASDAGVRGGGGLIADAAYAASKAGVLSLVKSVARELAGKGVRINALNPGPSDTPMHRGVSADLKARIAAGLPMKRMGRPDDMAAAILFLCSSAASFVYGAALDADGGSMFR